MSEQDNSNLAARVERLEALESIHNLRYDYWFAILDKSSEALVKSFTEDAVLEYGFDIVLKGLVEIREFFDMVLGSEDLKLQIPRGANGKVTMTGLDSAEGRWLVQVIALRHSEKAGSRINVQYFEKYRKVDGEWKISAMKNDYLSYENIEPRDGP